MCRIRVPYYSTDSTRLENRILLRCTSLQTWTCQVLRTCTCQIICIFITTHSSIISEWDESRTLAEGFCLSYRIHVKLTSHFRPALFQTWAERHLLLDLIYSHFSSSLHHLYYVISINIYYFFQSQTTHALRVASF